MKKTTHKLLLVCRVAIGLGLLVYLGAAGVITWSILLGLVEAWPLSLLALSLLLAVMSLTSWRLCILLQRHELHLTWLASFRLTLIGTFFNVCLPGATGGDVVRIFYATEGNAGRRIEVATIMVLDRVIGMFALLVLPLFMIPFYPHLLAAVPMLPVLLWAAAGLALALILGMLVCAIPRVRYSRYVLWILQKLPLGTYLARTADTVHAYRHNPGTLLAAILLSLGIQTLMVAVVLLLVQATNPAGASRSMAMLIPLGFMANALPVTPGGLGVGEAAFDRLFTLAHLTGGAEALLGWRLLMLMIGLLGLMFYLRGSRRFVYRLPALSPDADADSYADDGQRIISGWSGHACGKIRRSVSYRA